MKLQDLLSEGPSINIQRDDNRETNDLRVLGTGSQGRVFDRKTKPNMVTKVFGVNNPEKDGSIQFIKLASQHPNNPYFPRFANLRFYRKPFNLSFPNATVVNSYNLTAAVDIEKLVPVTHPKVVDIMTQKLQDAGVLMSGEELKDWFNMDRINPEAIRDDNLKEAILLIRKISPFTDTKADNLMVRLTSTGPQLVLVDPIFDPQ